MEFSRRCLDKLFSECPGACGLQQPEARKDKAEESDSDRVTAKCILSLIEAIVHALDTRWGVGLRLAGVSLGQVCKNYNRDLIAVLKGAHLGAKYCNGYSI